MISATGKNSNILAWQLFVEQTSPNNFDKSTRLWFGIRGIRSKTCILLVLHKKTNREISANISRAALTALYGYYVPCPKYGDASGPLIIEQS